MLRVDAVHEDETFSKSMAAAVDREIADLTRGYNEFIRQKMIHVGPEIDRFAVEHSFSGVIGIERNGELLAPSMVSLIARQCREHR